MKKNTGKSITKLRSQRARNYFVSIPGTLAVFRSNLMEWWCYTDNEIMNFLEKILSEGFPFIGTELFDNFFIIITLYFKLN